MRTPRLAALAAALTLSLALGACGGGGDKGDEPAQKDTTTEQTTTEAQGDPEAKAEMQAAVGDYNRGYEKFFRELKDNGGDFDRLKASVSDYRDVIYEFDAELRKIDFEDDLVPQVNAILENNRLLIEQLDAIGSARNYNQAINLYDRFLKVRTPQVKAVNNLLDQL